MGECISKESPAERKLQRFQNKRKLRKNSEQLTIDEKEVRRILD